MRKFVHVLCPKKMSGADEEHREARVFAQERKHRSAARLALPAADGGRGIAPAQGDMRQRLQGDHRETGPRQHADAEALDKHAEHERREHIERRARAAGDTVIHALPAVDTVDKELEIDGIERDGKRDIEREGHARDGALDRHGDENDQDCRLNEQPRPDEAPRREPLAAVDARGDLGPQQRGEKIADGQNHAEGCIGIAESLQIHRREADRDAETHPEGALHGGILRRERAALFHIKLPLFLQNSAIISPKFELSSVRTGLHIRFKYGILRP